MPARLQPGSGFALRAALDDELISYVFIETIACKIIIELAVAVELNNFQIFGGDDG